MPFDLFEYLLTFFGLSNASQTLRMMDCTTDGLEQRIYQTKKPRQRTRRPKTGPWSEFNAAILLNITLDPHEENTVHLVESTIHQHEVERREVE
jgi:hypothetical protein